MDKKKVTLIVEIGVFILALCAITGFYYFGGKEEVAPEEKTEEKAEIIKVNDDNFEEEVMNTDKTVILEFSSNSCPPCLTMIPTMNSIAKNNKDIKVCDVNTSEDNTEEITKKYNIEAFPTIYIIKNGKVVKNFVGATSEEAIMKEIK